MKTIHTAPMEILSPKANGAFFLEPHEAGWADEALAMIYVREVNGASAQLILRPQISADGVRWINLPSPTVTITADGGHCLTLKRFGNWIRLSGEVSGGPGGGTPTFVVDIYWVLKG